jgi:hypothetical protein
MSASNTPIRKKGEPPNIPDGIEEAPPFFIVLISSAAAFGNTASVFAAHSVKAIVVISPSAPEITASAGDES